MSRSLSAHPHAGAGLDHDPLAAGLDEQEVEPAAETAALIGVDEAAPQGLRHDPEEAARVGAEPARAHDPHGDATGEGSAAPRGERRRVTTGAPPDPFEVGVVAAGGRIGLPAVLRPDASVAVADLDGRREALEADLADLHAVVQLDRQVRDIAQLEGQRALPPGVDVARGRVDEEAEPAERATCPRAAPRGRRAARPARGWRRARTRRDGG